MRHAHGVSKVVHFGHIWPSIPDAEIEVLRSMIRDDSIHVISPEVEPRREIQITEGAKVCGNSDVAFTALGSLARDLELRGGTERLRMGSEPLIADLH